MPDYSMKDREDVIQKAATDAQKMFDKIRDIAINRFNIAGASMLRNPPTDVANASGAAAPISVDMHVQTGSEINNDLKAKEQLISTMRSSFPPGTIFVPTTEGVQVKYETTKENAEKLWAGTAFQQPKEVQTSAVPQELRGVVVSYNVEEMINAHGSEKAKKYLGEMLLSLEPGSEFAKDMLAVVNRIEADIDNGIKNPNYHLYFGKEGHVSLVENEAEIEKLNNPQVVAMPQAEHQAGAVPAEQQNFVKIEAKKGDNPTKLIKNYLLGLDPSLTQKECEAVIANLIKDKEIFIERKDGDVVLLTMKNARSLQPGDSIILPAQEAAASEAEKEEVSEAQYQSRYGRGTEQDNITFPISVGKENVLVTMPLDQYADLKKGDKVLAQDGSLYKISDLGHLALDGTNPTRRGATPAMKSKLIINGRNINVQAEAQGRRQQFLSPCGYNEQVGFGTAEVTFPMANKGAWGESEVQLNIISGNPLDLDIIYPEFIEGKDGKRAPEKKEPGMIDPNSNGGFVYMADSYFNNHRGHNAGQLAAVISGTYSEHDSQRRLIPMGGMKIGGKVILKARREAIVDPQDPRYATLSKSKASASWTSFILLGASGTAEIRKSDLVSDKELEETPNYLEVGKLIVDGGKSLVGKDKDIGDPEPRMAAVTFAGGKVGFINTRAGCTRSEFAQAISLIPGVTSAALMDGSTVSQIIATNESGEKVGNPQKRPNSHLIGFKSAGGSEMAKEARKSSGGSAENISKAQGDSSP